MAPKSLKKGIFISFEGPEGCGKSTHSKLLYDYLRRCGYPCIYTREPGGTKLGENIRRLLLHSNGIDISSLSELFLFEACRAQIAKELIRPALGAGKIVICDRFSDATVAYQGYGGRIAIKTIELLDKAATEGLKPDLTILLDIDTMAGLKRAKSKGIDRMERKDVAYHRRVRAGYLALAGDYPGRIKVIKVTGTIGQTQKMVRSCVEHVIQRYKRSG